MPTTNQSEPKSKTRQTIDKLRAITAELESLADQFPDITWHHAFNKPLWNGNRLMRHQTGTFYKVAVDEDNVGCATRVWVGTNGASAFVNFESLSNDIPVLYITGFDLCHLKHTRDQIVEVVEMLPEHLRLPIYKAIAHARRQHRKEKEQQREQLLQLLVELTQPG